MCSSTFLLMTDITCCREGKLWRTDGISSVVYDQKARLITFSLDTVGPVALIQDAHINMPYQSWELRPLEVNKVSMTVTTIFIELQIHIKVSGLPAACGLGSIAASMRVLFLELILLNKQMCVRVRLHLVPRSSQQAGQV